MKKHYLIFLVATFIISHLLIISAAFAERMSIASDIANIRSGPGTNTDILWKVEKYHPVEIIKKQNDWYQFKDYEGDKGWIHNSLLSSDKTVITKENVCNIRSGPSTKYPIVFTAEKGIPFKVLKEDKGWLNVEHSDGDKGWIHSSLVW